MWNVCISTITNPVTALIFEDIIILVFIVTIILIDVVIANWQSKNRVTSWRLWPLPHFSLETLSWSFEPAGLYFNIFRSGFHKFCWEIESSFLCVEKHWPLCFRFYSSYCAFIPSVPFKSIYHSFYMFLSGSFIFNFLSSSLLLHSHTATGKFSVVGACNSLDYAQKRTKILFYYKYVGGTNLISP